MNRVMTKFRLEQYRTRKLQQSIVCLREELVEMIETDMGIGSSTILDYRSGYGIPENVTGFDWGKYLDKQALLEKKEKEVKEIEAFINGIEDGQTRYVFRMRYYENLTWVQIAKKLGESDECYARKCIHDKYLKKVKSAEKSGKSVLEYNCRIR